MARLPPRPATPARFAIGMAQMFGDAAGLTLLITTGVSPVTLGVVARRVSIRRPRASPDR
jgi:hypothetical protein